MGVDKHDSRPEHLVFRMALWFLVALHPPAVMAHLLQTDGDIGVLMHVDPGDEPVVGETSTFMFEITDRREKFSLERCDCRLRVMLNDKEVFNEPLKGEQSASAAVPFVFPDAGIYHAQITGNPRPGEALQAFAHGKVPIVVPRQSAFGEHVDDHQVRFARKIADRILVVTDIPPSPS